MSKEIIGTGKTVQLATQFALKQVDLKEFESYDIEVLQEAKKGFLGIGSKDAKVAVKLKTDKIKMSEYLIQEISKFLNVKPEFKKEYKEEKNELKLLFSGDESDKFFEILGRSSKKLEFLLTTMLNKEDRDNYVKARFNHPSLSNFSKRRNNRKNSTSEENDGKENKEAKKENKNNKKGKFPKKDHKHNKRDKNFSGGKISSVREDFIRSNAKKMARKVLDSQEPVALAPMNSYERRLVHTALKEFDNIATKSEGSDKDRHIVIEYSA